MRFRFHHLVITAICAVIIAVLATSLFFTTDLGDHPKAADALIKTITHNSVNIIHHFNGPGDLQGFIVQSKDKSGAMGILYTDRRGKYIFDGIILNAKGENLTRQAFMQFIAPKKAGDVMQVIDKTQWIAQGNNNAPHKAYIVVDPNCIFCHQLFETLQPEIAKGNLAVRWIVVGFLKPSSPGKAMAILSAKDPLTALKTNEQQFNTGEESGGITPIAQPTKSQKSMLLTNNDFVKKFQIFQTPVIFYKTAKGQARMQAGLPHETVLQAVIKNMGSRY